jgi:radical SAM protein with 4Fe4S-binding SPASM domain
MKELTLWQRLFTVQRPQLPPPLPTGLHAFQKSDGEYHVRYHLRVEPNGAGLLVVNATTAVQLSPPGVIMAQHLLHGRDPEDTKSEIKQRFHGVSGAQFQHDYDRLQKLIAQWQRPTSASTARAHVTNLQDAAFVPETVQLFAPLEADVPLAPLEQLRPLLTRLWHIGIPHVTLLLPPEPDGATLVKAVERAEDLGMICGVRGIANALYDTEVVAALAQSGLDYATLVYLTSDNVVQNQWLGQDYGAKFTGVVTQLQYRGIYTTAEVPLIAANATSIPDIVGYLDIAGIRDIAFVAYAGEDGLSEAELDGALTAGALRQVAVSVEEAVEARNIRFHWEPPVARNPNVPLVEQIIAGPRTAGDAAVRVEPDGTIYPPRGANIPAGNIFNDEWATIWNHPAFTRYRERVAAPTHCALCPGLALCAADCPADPNGWARE